MTAKLAIVSSGCVTLDTTRPIEKSSFLSVNRYEQDGRVLEYWSASSVPSDAAHQRYGTAPFTASPCTVSVDGHDGLDAEEPRARRRRTSVVTRRDCAKEKGAGVCANPLDFL
jgi:hypothetical protein